MAKTNVFDANVCFEGQKLYGLEREQIVSVHCRNGDILRYAMRQENNVLSISNLSGGLIAEIIALEKDNITVMDQNKALKGNLYVNIIAITPDKLEFKCMCS